MIAVSSDRDRKLLTVGLRSDCEHRAGPTLLRQALTAPK